VEHATKRPRCIVHHAPKAHSVTLGHGKAPSVPGFHIVRLLKDGVGRRRAVRDERASMLQTGEFGAPRQLLGGGKPGELWGERRPRC
jgi:hypothetical protein